MPRRLPRDCVEDVDRHGNVRIYLRLPGQKKIRLRGMVWSPEFMLAYGAARQGEEPKVRGHRGKTGTWRWLCQQYFASTEFAKLDPHTQTVQRQRLEATFEEPIRPGAKALFGDMPVRLFGKKAVRVLRDRKSKVPEGANNRVKAIRRVFSWANDTMEELDLGNPAKEVKLFSGETEGYYTWTVDDVLQFQSVHPPGSQARLALTLGLFAGGPRREDLARLGPQMVRDGVLRYKPSKTRKTSGKWIVVPILPELQAEINRAPQNHLAWITTKSGKPYTRESFGNKFKEWCYEANLPQCSCHGMRKAGATIAAENGATDAQLMALFGWETVKMAAHYRKQAQQEKLAAAAVGFLRFEKRSAQETGASA
jgi:integrase